MGWKNPMEHRCSLSMEGEQDEWAAGSVLGEPTGGVKQQNQALTLPYSKGDCPWVLHYLPALAMKLSNTRRFKKKAQIQSASASSSKHQKPNLNGLRPRVQELCFLLMRSREESVLSLSVSRRFLCSFHYRHLPFSAHISPALPVVPLFISTFVVTSLNPPGEPRILPISNFMR